MDYEANLILSRYKIREISKFIRKMFKIRTIMFPVMKVLDLLESKFPDILYYYVDEDFNFEKNVMATLEAEDDNTHFHIKIRRSVYDKAIKGDNSSLGFICHEICHFILIYIFGITPVSYKNSDGVCYTRAVITGSIPPYKSMEWQAMALCGEVMIPYERCKNYSLEEIVKKTKSSIEQTNYFLTHVVKGSDKMHNKK